MMIGKLSHLIGKQFKQKHLTINKMYGKMVLDKENKKIIGDVHMEFELENLQSLMENHNFGGERNLLIEIDKQSMDEKDGYDLIVYDVTDIEYHLVNVTELHMYCFDEGLDEETFEIDRVTFVRGEMKER